MNFVSTLFVGFLLATWLLFMVLPKRYRTILLTVASYIFYATWSIPFIAVILLTTTVDYIASRCIYDNFRDLSKKKLAITIALTINLLVLFLFKYLNLLLGTSDSLLSMAGIHNPIAKHLDIILPLGISYYTFEAVSYVVDVYRGGKPAKNWIDYNFYIMYFPHLISGPIIRFSELAHQYKDGLERPSGDRIARGIELIVLGYLFKVVIANNAALVADPTFANPAGASALTAFLGCLAFTTQVYFDFMGYTHIARGVSLLFNIELPVNFDHAFNATNISNFWQRWQISLSRWIRDYLFIPLGGSKHGSARTIFNLLLVMAIAGAWHGAGWTYIVWGFFHGTMLGVYHVYKALRIKVLGQYDSMVTENPIYRVVSIALTFATVAVACMIFRAADLKDAWILLGKSARVSALISQLGKSIHTDPVTVVSIVVLMLCCFSGPMLVRLYNRLFVELPLEFKLSAATCVCVLCWIMCGPGAHPFIYFQF